MRSHSPCVKGRRGTQQSIASAAILDKWFCIWCYGLAYMEDMSRGKYNYLEKVLLTTRWDSGHVWLGMVAINTVSDRRCSGGNNLHCKAPLQLRTSLTYWSPQIPQNIKPDVFIQRLNDNLYLLVKTESDLLGSSNNYFFVLWQDKGVRELKTSLFVPPFKKCLLFLPFLQSIWFFLQHTQCTHKGVMASQLRCH